MINEKREEVCAKLAHTTRNATVEGKQQILETMRN